MKRRKLVAAAASLLALVALAVELDSRAREARLAERVRALEERGVLPARGAELPASAELGLRLDRLEGLLDELGLAPEVGAPATWGRATLAAELAPLERFYAEVDALLASDAAATRARGEPRRAPRATRLARVRRWSDLLGAAAVAAAERGAGDVALERIAQAFDLAQLCDGGSLIELLVRQAAEGVALKAAGVLAACPAVDPAGLRRALDARLARSATGELLVRALSAEVAAFLDALALREHAGPLLALPRRGAVAAARALCDDLELALARASASTPAALAPLAIDDVARPGAPLVLSVRGSLQARRQLTLARVALALLVERAERGAWPSSLAALAPRFDGVVPVDPGTGEAFAYSVEAERARVACRGEERAGGLMSWELGSDG